MAQTTALVNTLKRTLKAHGKTYVDVGQALALSEASVKRLFSREDFSLERLDRICQLIGIEITDLVELMNAEQRQLEQLTIEQEQQLVDDKTLLAVAICALNKWTMDEIVAFYDITEGQCFQKLAMLDKLKLIDLLPHNRIKVLVAPNFRWQENGPIQKLFQERLGNEFLHGKFKGDDESLIVFNGMLSKHNIAELKNKLRRLAWELNVANREDSALPLAERHGITAVLAVRGWQYGLFHPLRNPPASGAKR